MKKTKLELLFQLIKSLTKSEKRHFSIQTEFHDPKNRQYLNLFNFLDSLDKYDINVIKKYFAENKANSYIDRYLLEKILMALRIYHRNNTLVIQTNNLLENVEILLQKGLIVLAQQQLDEVKKMADKYDWPEVHLRIMLLELKFADLNSLNFTQLEDIYIFQKRSEKLISQVASFSNFMLSFYFVRYYITPPNFAKEESQQILPKIKQIIEQNYIQIPTDIEHIDNKSLYYYVKGYYEFLTNGSNYTHEREPLYIYLKMLLEDFEKYPNLIPQKFTFFINILNSFLVNCISVKKFDTFFEYLPKLKNAVELYQPNLFKMKEGLARTEGFACYLELLAQSRLKNYLQAYNMKPNVEMQIKKYKKYLPNAHQQVMKHLLVSAEFYTRHFEECIINTNILLENNYIKNSRTLYFSLIIIQILTHYEMNNNLLIKSLLKRMVYHCEKQKCYENTEQLFVEMMRKLISKTGTGSEQKILKQYRSKFAQNSNYYAEDGIDIVFWIDNKLQV